MPPAPPHPPPPTPPPTHTPLQYRNEELHRLQEASPGTSYRVLTTVLTTAMHGEKFRRAAAVAFAATPPSKC